MTPKEKAKELVNKFYAAICNLQYEPNCVKQTMLITIAGASSIQYQQAKRAALIAIDEIKEALLSILDNDISSIHAIYWEKVKEEIKKL